MVSYVSFDISSFSQEKAEYESGRLTRSVGAFGLSHTDVNHNIFGEFYSMYRRSIIIFYHVENTYCTNTLGVMWNIPEASSVILEDGKEPESVAASIYCSDDMYKFIIAQKEMLSSLGKNGMVLTL